MPPMIPGSAVSVRYRSTRSSRRDRRNPFGHADAEIDDATQRQFERAAPRDNFPFVQRQRWHAVERHALPAGIGVVISRAIGLQMVFGLREHDAIDEHARNDYLRGLSDSVAAMRSTCAMTSPPELRAAIAIARLSSVSASRSIVMLPGGIGGRAAQDRDLNRKGFIDAATPRRRFRSIQPDLHACAC